MPGGQHHGLGGKLLSVLCAHPGEPALAYQQFGDAAAEAHFATSAHDGLAHGGDDAGKFVGADVRVGVHEDVG